MASNLATNSRDINIRLKQLLESGFDKSPFFTQELATRVAYSYIVNPELFEDLGHLSSEESDGIDTNLINYILGSAGTGKTNVIFKSLISFLKNNNPKLKV